jgi:multicomponent K+:H+ antiporter subunit E
MRRLIPFPLLWALLVAMWLLLNGTLAPGHLMLGALLALGAVHAYARLESSQPRLRRPMLIVRLAALVLTDIVRSNIAVARIVLHLGIRNRRAGFVRIPLELRDPVGLAALACIITATPGTAWARYEPARGLLTIHVLDLSDDDAWVRTIKERYEERLLEILK